METSRRPSKRIELSIALALGLSGVTLLAVFTGFAAGWQNSRLVFLILAAVVGSVVIFVRPAFGAALILATAPLEGFFTIGGYSAVMLASVLCVVVYVSYALIRRKRILWDPLAGLAAALALWALVSVFWSPYPLTTISDWTSFALEALLYLLMINVIKTREDFRLALWGHVLGGLVLSVRVINVILATDFARSEWVIGFGIDLASRLIGLTLLLAVLLYQLETRGWRKLVLLLIGLLAGVGVVITLSRGTWLGVGASLAILILFAIVKGQPNRALGWLMPWLLAGLILFLILTAYILNEHGTTKLMDRFQSGVTLSDAAGHRLDIWQVGWTIFQESPVWGHGFGSFKTEFSLYNELGGDIKGPHNAVVLMGTTLGLVGVVLLVLIFVAAFVTAWRFVRNKPAITSGMAPWGMALLVFLLVASLVDSGVDRKYFWYILSMITLLARFWAPEQREELEAQR